VGIVDELLSPILDHLARKNPGGVVGVYLFGSTVDGGAKPDSDVDLLMLTDRSLNRSERADLVSLLLPLSGWKRHASDHPDAASRRPIELTGIAIGSERPFTVQPGNDFQYGEWLRDSMLAGELPAPADDPDTVPLVATALTAYRVLAGPALDGLVAPIPSHRLRDGLLATIPDILQEIEGDERNTLLALARTIVTLETGTIAPKDVAADRIAPTLSATDRELLERARDGYLGRTDDRWDGCAPAVTVLAHHLAVRAHAR